MKPRFEEHEGKLFCMLDKPVPLKEKDTNVLVQFITHGIIGEYVMEHWLDCGQENAPIFVDSVDSDGDVTVCIENGNEHHCCPFPMFEIIGYPAVEGSHWWALYQMMQGKKVSHKSAIGNVYWALNQDGDVQYYDMDSLSYISSIRSKLEFGKNHAVKTGWQIYKEPEPAKVPIADCDNCKHRCPKSNIDYCHMYEPKPTSFKVGDWVEHKESKEQATIRRIMSYGAIEIEFAYSTESDIYQANDFHNDFRKLSPSEVIVRIGCLSGTVRCCENEFICPESTPNNPCHFVLQNQITGFWSIIYFKMLDAPTRELVQSLLKAQIKEKEQEEK